MLFMTYQVRRLSKHSVLSKTFLADSRADDYFLGSSPLPMVAILIAYYQFTYNIGPKLMEKRQPFQLERVLILYNLFQIISNLYLFIKVR